MNTLRLRNTFNIKNQEPVDVFPKPFITISRDPGSGGAPIAKRLAEKLNFKLVDKQIVGQIAKSIKKKKSVVESIDEKSRNQINDIVHSVLNKDYVDDYTYLSELTKIILAYAHEGHVVILGRGSNFICPFAKGLHVRVTAPYETRVNRAIEYEGFNQRKAREVIAKVEKERDKFIHQYFSKKKDYPKSRVFDLTVNTQNFDIEEAANIILEAFYTKFPMATRYKAILGIK
jgi:cytidylate kinase